MANSTDEVLPAVCGCGCFGGVSSVAVAVLFSMPVWTVAHWVNWLPIQLLTSALLFYSIFWVVAVPVTAIRALVYGRIDEEARDILLPGFVVVPLACGLLYLMWMAIGAEKRDPSKDLPEFRSSARTNNAKLPDGVYVFECPNAILGQSHWGLWIPNRGGFELSGEASTLTSGMDYSNPYWRELEAEPSCGAVRFAGPVPISVDDVIVRFNAVRGVDQLHWDANNNCKTQTILFLAGLANQPPADFRDAYCKDLDCAFTTPGKPLVDRDAAQAAPWYTRRIEAMCIILFVQPLALLLLLGLIAGGARAGGRKKSGPDTTSKTP